MVQSKVLGIRPLMTAFAYKAALAVAVTLTVLPVMAQNYPSQIIRLVVPFPAGGGTDLLARVLRSELEESLGQTVIVENRAGAGGMTGALSVINSPPDGYTFLVGDNATNSFVPAMAKAPRYDPVKDVTAVGFLLEVPNVLIVHPSVPVNSTAELIELAKSKPGQLNYGTAGYGSFSHVATELLNIRAGIRLFHVPYKGGGEVVPALLRGDVQVLILPLRVAQPHILSGKMKPLAVTSRNRSPALPDLHPLSEIVPGYDAMNWYGLFAPAKLPQPILARVSSALDKAMDAKVVQDFVRNGGTEVQKMKPAEFKKFASDDFEKWSKLINDSGIEKN